MDLLDSWWLFELIVYVLPYSVVWLTGLVLALVFWKKCSQAALMVLLACIIELIDAIGGTLFQHWVLGFHGFALEGSPLWMITSVVRSALGVTAWTLMFFAAFGWRRQWHVAPSDRRPRPLPPRQPPAPPGIPEEVDPETIREQP